MMWWWDAQHDLLYMLLMPNLLFFTRLCPKTCLQVLNFACSFCHELSFAISLVSLPLLVLHFSNYNCQVNVTHYYQEGTKCPIYASYFTYVPYMSQAVTTSNNNTVYWLVFFGDVVRLGCFPLDWREAHAIRLTGTILRAMALTALARQTCQTTSAMSAHGNCASTDVYVT